MKSTYLLVGIVLSAAVGSTYAQQAQSDSPSTANVPSHKCEKPTGGPGLDKNNYERQQRFQKKVDVYKDCINVYTKDMDKKAGEHYELGKQYQEAGNAAINEYNAYVTGLNAQYGDKGSDSKSAPSEAVPAPAAGKKY
jgi:hypothetical protein